MNYLAHGYRFISSPLMLAGTAVPDWLSVVDRQVRVRSRVVTARFDELDATGREVATGILQHLDDDDRFHRCPRFMLLESAVSAMFRAFMPDQFDHRPPFLGHVLTELMLDAVIAERDPKVLRTYYQAMQHVAADEIQNVVNLLARFQTDRLSGFIDQFRRVQFLFDYLDDRSLLARLNQVLRRVKLPGISEETLPVLAEARRLVRIHADELLHWVEQPERLAA